MRAEFYQWISANSKVNIKTRAKHGVIIINDCGKSIIYRINTGKNQILAHDDKSPVEVGSQSDRISLSIYEEGFDYKFIKNIKWDKVGTTIFRRISDIDPTERLVVEVKNIQGGYSVLVRSDESIYNGTGVPLELIIKGKLTTSPEYIYFLEHQQSRSIPLDFIGGLCDISIRPHHDYPCTIINSNNTNSIQLLPNRDPIYI